jgi:phage terminase large subunit-like protein
MTITTPSGYVVVFKEEDELTYGDRRAIQKAMVKSMKIDPAAKGGGFSLTGEVLFDAQEATLKTILKSITKPDGITVTGDLFAEIMSWKNQADGDAVFEVVQKSMGQQSPKAPTT